MNEVIETTADELADAFRLWLDRCDEEEQKQLLSAAEADPEACADYLIELIGEVRDG